VRTGIPKLVCIDVSIERRHKWAERTFKIIFAYQNSLRLGHETLIIFLIIIIVQVSFAVTIHVHLIIVTLSGRRHLPPDQVHCEFTTRAPILKDV
jgi:hypothetical protein